MKKTIEQIAHIETPFKDKFGVPRQSGRIAEAEGRIIFEKKFRNADALRGIENFSHLWLLFDFSLVDEKDFQPTVRPPRLGGNEKVGVFASRSPYRPNTLGLSSVKLERIDHTEKDGVVLVVSGVDIVDGTPIFDVKPYVGYSDCHTDARCGFADENANHKLKVGCDEKLLATLPERLRKLALDVVADDPRPSFQNDNKRIYGVRLDNFDVRFVVDGDNAEIVEIAKVKD